jgi:hypothetical protein
MNQVFIYCTSANSWAQEGMYSADGNHIALVDETWHYYATSWYTFLSCDRLPRIENPIEVQNMEEGSLYPSPAYRVSPKHGADSTSDCLPAKVRQQRSQQELLVDQIGYQERR